jgi:isocitrate dehydrogenase
MFAKNNQKMKTITVAKGDGIGPEIMEATMAVLKASGAPIEFEEIQIGEQVYLGGNTSGIDQSAWESIRKTKVFLKAPITTPQGGGYKSLNVTMRKTLGLFANVRPCASFHPYVHTKHPVMDVVIIRENEEDLYAGIEHQQTNDVVQCLKLISKAGCERIIRYAFEYAKHYNRKKVTCFSKDNIMKQTDGLFHATFNEIAKEYPEIENEHWIVDIGAARLADTPERFDVIVMQNLYGDILSDVAAQITGSVGLAGSSNIGSSCAMFEAIHGSAPDIAGKQMANPSGLIQASVLMLNHLGLNEFAEKIQNAWLKTIEDGTHTADIFHESVSKRNVSTMEFAQAVINNLGQQPAQLKKVSFTGNSTFPIPEIKEQTPKEKALVGIDVFVDHHTKNPDELGSLLSKFSSASLKLQMITNRGVKVWPNGFSETYCTNHWRCRFMPEANGKVAYSEALGLLSELTANGVDVIKTENLYTFDGKLGFSLGQGQ